jgi:hypothetical protein
MKVRDRIRVITDILLGAAHSDAAITDEESRAVREVLGELLLCAPDALPIDVDMRIQRWEPASFDLERAARDFLEDPPMRPRRLLELVATMTDRDGTDLREDEYLRRLAHCLGMPPAEYADLVLEWDEVTVVAPAKPRAQPPPIPEAARKKRAA